VTEACVLRRPVCDGGLCVAEACVWRRPVCGGALCVAAIHVSRARACKAPSERDSHVEELLLST
jgi:hypothetical protein